MKKFFSLSILFLLVLAVLPACSDDPKDAPKPPTGGGSGTGTSNVLTDSDLVGVWAHDNDMSTYVFFNNHNGQTFITRQHWSKDIDPVKTSWSLSGKTLTITQLADRDEFGDYDDVWEEPGVHRLTVVSVSRYQQTNEAYSISVMWEDGEVQTLNKITSDPGVNPFIPVPVSVTASQLVGVWTHNENSTYVLYPNGDGQTYLTKYFWERDLEPDQTTWSLTGTTLTVRRVASRNNDGVYVPVDNKTYRMVIRKFNGKSMVVQWEDGEKQLFDLVTSDPGVNPFR